MTVGVAAGGVRVTPWSPDRTPAVRAFNERLAEHGVRYHFPEEETADDHYLAIDRSGGVRGGYIIKRRDYFVSGERRSLGFYRLPLSEGLVDPQYGTVGVQLLADALKRQPELFVLGIGGFDEPLARMLGALGWKLQEVPFYFRIVHPFRFARGMRHLRRTRLARLALDAAAITGAAWAGAALMQTKAASRRHQGLSTVVVEQFDAWADTLCAASQSHYDLVGTRDAATLNRLYPVGSPRFIRLQVRQGGDPIGWAVLLDTQMSSHTYFGTLRVGTIVDCLADPKWAHAVVARATQMLTERGVDLIVTNQSARCWRDGLRAEGFLERPSGFLFGASRALTARLSVRDTGMPQYHLTRGDGDGPIHL